MAFCLFYSGGVPCSSYPFSLFARVQLEKHGSLWGFVSEISKESGDKGIIRAFHVANALHRNFYENEMTREAVEVALEDIEKLIAKLQSL